MIEHIVKKNISEYIISVPANKKLDAPIPVIMIIDCTFFIYLFNSVIDIKMPMRQVKIFNKIAILSPRGVIPHMSIIGDRINGYPIGYKFAMGLLGKFINR